MSDHYNQNNNNNNNNNNNKNKKNSTTTTSTTTATTSKKRFTVGDLHMMALQMKLKWMKLSTVMGSIIMLLPNSLQWYWGNMSIYSMSYVVNVLDSTSGVDTPWVISLFFAFWTLGCMGSSLIASRIGRRWAILIGAVTADIGVVSSYFTNQHSVMALNFTMGVVVGCGVGLIDGSTLQLVIDWADDDVGFLTSLIQTSFSIGGLFINEFVTYYTNPLNLSPDMELGKQKYFSQKVVLDKVLPMYLFLGLISLGVHVLGFLMLRPKQQYEEIYETEMVNIKDNRSCTKSWTNENEHRISEKRCFDEHIISHEKSHHDDPNIAPSSTRDYTPKEMLKTFSFYALWISYFLGDTPLLILTNYYKVYGQRYIPDDHFLTNLGTAFIFFNALANVLWGLAMDRFGVKNCLIVFMSTCTLGMAWYYFTPMVSRWLYAIATCVLGCLAGSLFPCFTAAMALLYGKTHLSTNFGIIMTSSFVCNCIAPYLLQFVLTNFGWFQLFDLASTSTLVSFVLILIFIPHV